MTYIKKFENDYISILENIKKIKDNSSIDIAEKKELYGEELLKLGELRYKFKRLEKVFNNGKSENGEELSLNQVNQLGKFVSYFYIFNDKDSNINNILSTSEEYGIYSYSVLHREFVDNKYILYSSGSITEEELLKDVKKHKEQTVNMISNSFGLNKSIELCEEELNEIKQEKEEKRTLKYVKLFATVALASVVAASAFSCHKNNVKDNNNATEKNVDDKSNNKSNNDTNNDTKNETSTSKNKEDTTETKENNDKITNSKENTENSNKSSISSNGKTSTNGTLTNDKSNTGGSSKTTTNGGGVDLDRDKAQNGDVTITQGDGKTIAPDDSKVEGNDYVIVDDNFDGNEDKINDSVYQPDKQDTYSEDTNHKTTRPSTDKVQGSDEQKTNVNLNESSDKVNDSVNQPDKQDKTVEEKSTTTTPTIIEEDENDIEYFFVPNNNVSSNNDIYVEDFEDYDTSGYEIEEDSAYTLTLN